MQATISLESLWQLIQTLSKEDKRWLTDKLIEEEVEEEAPLTPYTMEELNARIDEAEAELEAGEPGYSLEEFDARTRQQHRWAR